MTSQTEAAIHCSPYSYRSSLSVSGGALTLATAGFWALMLVSRRGAPKKLAALQRSRPLPLSAQRLRKQVRPLVAQAFQQPIIRKSPSTVTRIDKRRLYADGLGSEMSLSTNN